MRIACCLFAYHPYGGLQRDFLRIANLCRERGHQVSVFTMQWQGDMPDGLAVALFPPRPWMRNHTRARYFARAVQARTHTGNFDLVLGFNRMPGLDAYYAADPCYAARIRDTHGRLYRLSARYRQFATYERAVFSQAAQTRILMLSELEIERYRQCYGTPLSRFHLLPPNIDRDRCRAEDAQVLRHDIRAELSIANDVIALLFVGSDFARKGLDRAIRAISALPAEYASNCRLLVAGDDNARGFAGLARRLGVADRVSFLQGRDDVPALLAAVDLLIHPAYSENTGTVLLEAVVAGVPVLTTAVCGYAHHIRQADAGFVIDEPYSQKALNDALARMLSDGRDAQRRSNAIRYSRTEDLYGMPQTVCDLLERFAGEKAA